MHMYMQMHITLRPLGPPRPLGPMPQPAILWPVLVVMVVVGLIWPMDVVVVVVAASPSLLLVLVLVLVLVVLVSVRAPVRGEALPVVLVPWALQAVAMQVP
jgi:hypothetical protein